MDVEALRREYHEFVENSKELEVNPDSTFNDSNA
jgi:hypothetical protein